MFLGRHVAEAALARGWTVTLFHRGISGPAPRAPLRPAQADVLPECEHVFGDREVSLGALTGRMWDAVIDTSGKLPRVVRGSVEALRGAVGRYVFVSSVSVYPMDFPGHGEGAPTLELPSPEAEAPELYGALKAACEQVVREAFGEDVAHVVRPGLIAGPHDPTGRFTYWCVRGATPGPMLAPGEPSRTFQVIDARDVAGWMLDAIEQDRGGTWNLCGPAWEATMGELLALCGPATPVWMDDDFLEAQGVSPWSELPLWLPAKYGTLHAPNARALAAGLRLRPLAETIADTRAWALAHRAAHPDWRERVTGDRRDLTLTPEREAEVLAAFANRGGNT